jgi:hypothetical protein
MKASKIRMTAALVLAVSSLALPIQAMGAGKKPPKGSIQCSASGWSLEQDCHHNPHGGTVCTPHAVRRSYVGDPAATQKEAQISALEACDGWASSCELDSCWKN